MFQEEHVWARHKLDYMVLHPVPSILSPWILGQVYGNIYKPRKATRLPTVPPCSRFLQHLSVTISSHHNFKNPQNYPQTCIAVVFGEDSLLQTHHFNKNDTGSGKFWINLPIQLSFPEVSHRWWTTGGPAAPDSGTNLNMQRHEKGKGSIEPHHYFFQGNATCPKIENLQSEYIYIILYENMTGAE